MPLPLAQGVSTLVVRKESFERQGLVYFDDFFEMSGNWPAWLSVFVIGTRG